MFYINIIESCRGVVAICDAELLGKTFEHGNIQLDIKENFYANSDKEEFTEEQAKSIIQTLGVEDATFNIVGKKSIKLALEFNLIPENSVKEIQGVPYSMVLM